MAELFDDGDVDRWTPLRSPSTRPPPAPTWNRRASAAPGNQRTQFAITTDGTTPMGEILLFRTGTPGEAELAYAAGPRTGAGNWPPARCA